MTDGVGGGGRVGGNFNLRIPTTARQQPQGMVLGQARQGNAMPPLPVAPQNVQLARQIPPPPTRAAPQPPGQQPPAPPVPQKTHGMIVDANTKLADLSAHFGTLPPGKTLRLFTHPDGTQELHLKNDAKKTNLLSGKAAGKHAAAAKFVHDVLTRELQAKGIGGEGAAILKAAKVDPKNVTVGNLGTLEDRVKTSARNADRQKDAAEDLRKAAKLDRDFRTWNTADNGQTLAGLAQRRQVAEQAISGASHIAKTTAFCDGDAHVDANKDFAMSANGGGGVLFVTETSPQGVKTGVALKIEHPSMLATADHVSKLGDGIASRVASPLPFDMPRHELINIDANSPEHAVLQTKLQDLVTAGGPRADKAQERLDDLTQHHQASKYELLKGRQMTDVPFEQRAAMFKDSALPKDLGKSAMLMPVLGLNDHLSVGQHGSANLANVFLGDDGRLKLIDFDTPASGTRKGYTGDQVKETVADVVSFLEKLAAAPDVGKLITEEVTRANRSPPTRTAIHSPRC
jgi:hypothetical protein